MVAPVGDQPIDRLWRDVIDGRSVSHAHAFIDQLQCCRCARWLFRLVHGVFAHGLRLCIVPLVLST